MFKKAKIVMLPTNEKAKIGMINLEPYNREGHKLELIHYVTNGDGLNPQHLYITSNEEIKEGDWFIANQAPRKCIRIDSNTSCPYITLQKDEEIGHFKTWHNIVIASTNPSLNLPQPSQSFIEKYIEEYNKSQQITNILVGYDEIKTAYEGVLHCLMVSPKDNTITIRKVKDSWNKEEVFKIIHKYRIEMGIPGNCNDKDCDKWIEENL